MLLVPESHPRNPTGTALRAPSSSNRSSIDAAAVGHLGLGSTALIMMPRRTSSVGRSLPSRREFIVAQVITFELQRRIFN